ncbi:MAG: hypothetical protein K6E38_02440 [Fretibacterium sp.]|nr:hypothetical protein [Fretibacterium sp.]
MSKKTVFAAIILCAVLGGLFAARTHLPWGRVDFKYKHNPMENPKAAADIIVNPNAVYGYSPNPESTRIGNFATAIDWTNSDDVAKARAIREAYHERNKNLWELFSSMESQGYSIEEIARAVSRQKNLNRLSELDSKNLALTKASNLETYGNEEGPDADSLHQKYGSWETVIDKAISTNPGMDACCGLYDTYYHQYRFSRNE